MFYVINLERAAALALVIAVAAFVSAFAVLRVAGHADIELMLAAGSSLGLDIAAAALAAFIATFALGAVLMRYQALSLAQYRAAVDSMPHGLCMFDSAERLVVCNSQYYGMYNLTADDVRQGASLAEVLQRRVARGTFARDPHEYRKQFLRVRSRGTHDQA